jgi:alkylhydroperoxidase family enzyme
MTRHIEVPVEVVERLQKALGNQETVEMIAVVATYNMVSRFLIATGVSPENH